MTKQITKTRSAKTASKASEKPVNETLGDRNDPIPEKFAKLVHCTAAIEGSRKYSGTVEVVHVFRNRFYGTVQAKCTALAVEKTERGETVKVEKGSSLYIDPRWLVRKGNLSDSRIAQLEAERDEVIHISARVISMTEKALQLKIRDIPGTIYFAKSKVTEHDETLGEDGYGVYTVPAFMIRSKFGETLLPTFRDTSAELSKEFDLDE